MYVRDICSETNDISGSAISVNIYSRENIIQIVEKISGYNILWIKYLEHKLKNWEFSFIPTSYDFRNDDHNISRYNTNSIRNAFLIVSIISLCVTKTGEYLKACVLM